MPLCSGLTTTDRNITLLEDVVRTETITAQPSGQNSCVTNIFENELADAQTKGVMYSVPSFTGDYMACYFENLNSENNQTVLIRGKIPSEFEKFSDEKSRIQCQVVGTTVGVVLTFRFTTRPNCDIACLVCNTGVTPNACSSCRDTDGFEALASGGSSCNCGTDNYTKFLNEDN